MSAHTPQPAPSRAILPVLIFTAMVMAVIATLGTPLVPTIAIDQGVSLEAAQWVLTVTLLVGSIATPITGRLGDGPHRKRAILLTLVSVCLGAALAAFSTNFTMLIIGRAMQGVGLGLVPLAISVARDEVPKAKLRSAVALLSITTAAGAGLGYPVTGIIAEHFDYRVGFGLAAVLSFIALLLVARFIPTVPNRPAHSLDIIGAGLLSLSLLSLLLALSQGHSWGWTSVTTITLFIAAVLLLGLWIRFELGAAHPLVDLRLMANRSVMTADIVAFMMGISLFAMSSLVNRFVQAPAEAGYGFHAGLVATGIMLMPLSFGSLAANRVSATLATRMNAGTLIALGAFLVGGDMVFLAMSRSSRWEIFLAVGILGLGIGITFAAMPTMIIGAVPVHETGSATSMNSVLRNIGGAVGSAASITLLSSYTPAGGTLPSNTGYTVTFGAGAAICIAAAIISLFLFPKQPPTEQVSAFTPTSAAVSSPRTA